MKRAAVARPPAGFFPANALFPWITMAGTALHCGRCNAEGKAPLPRDPGYGAAVERFVAAHRECS